MKKRYQISKRRAAESFQDWAATNRKPIQLTFPTQSIAELSQRSLGDLLRSVGKLFIETVMESEVEQVVGPTQPAEPKPGGLSLGERIGLLCDRWPASADPAATGAQSGPEQRDTAGKLRTVPTRISYGRNRLAQNHVWAQHAQLQRSGAAVRRRLWIGKEHDQRPLY